MVQVKGPGDRLQDNQRRYWSFVPGIKSEWNAMDEAKRNKLQGPGMKAWGDWMLTHKVQPSLQKGVLSGRRSERRRKEYPISKTI
jgi:hypothetical protein